MLGTKSVSRQLLCCERMFSFKRCRSAEAFFSYHLKWREALVRCGQTWQFTSGRRARDPRDCDASPCFRISNENNRASADTSCNIHNGTSPNHVFSGHRTAQESGSNGVHRWLTTLTCAWTLSRWQRVGEGDARCRKWTSRRPKNLIDSPSGGARSSRKVGSRRPGHRWAHHCTASFGNRSALFGNRSASLGNRNHAPILAIDWRDFEMEQKQNVKRTFSGGASFRSCGVHCFGTINTFSAFFVSATIHNSQIIFSQTESQYFFSNGIAILYWLNRRRLKKCCKVAQAGGQVLRLGWGRIRLWKGKIKQYYRVYVYNKTFFGHNKILGETEQIWENKTNLGGSCFGMPPRGYGPDVAWQKYAFKSTSTCTFWMVTCELVLCSRIYSSIKQIFKCAPSAEHRRQFLAVASLFPNQKVVDVSADRVKIVQEDIKFCKKN